MDRFLRIASEYGERLGKNNLRDGALERLLVKYPSHGFVIDAEEARDLFTNVEEPCQTMEDLAAYLKVLGESTLDGDGNFVYFISEEPPEPTPPSPVETAMPSVGAESDGGVAPTTEPESTNGTPQDSV